VFIVACLCIQQENTSENEAFWQYGLVFAVASFLLGATSGFYHASMKFIGQWMDNFGMYLIICWAFSYNMVRVAKSRKGLIFSATYSVLLLVFGLINILLPDIRRYSFFGMVLIYIVSQVVVDWRIKPNVLYRYWAASLGVLAIAFVFWILDNTGITCNPESWYQGHAIWHCLDGLSIFLLFFFYYTEKEKPSEYMNQIGAEFDDVEFEL
jgi:hypothetical protein